ncbi:UDP-glucose 4-epimerase GalE [Flavobacteriaceae bacterium]|nr:UDP-glucose 4-epimerase GalE [Flavobacteriaceae bacterium]MDA8849314.1 UDP-glucose 4-epimerase GalE [Flavobacteriaceae bacterium]MDC1392272.1 UDP-glucose 4-epimerase GalE [Flavobacteriaceae bacterium]
MKILVTGGLGYIGSHVTVLLLEQGHEVICVDNLENSSIQVLEGIEAITGKKPHFEALNVCDESQMEHLFFEHSNLNGIIHFAAHKAVGESVSEPLKYYKNNIGGLINVLKHSTKNSIPFIFSSSCTVYGQADILPIDENAPLKKAYSPYGNTKQIGEQIIQDCCLANENFKAILLRYFNPIGAHSSAKIGEYPQGVPQNLIPFLTQTVIGKHPILKVFGAEYDTLDGTCIRDYIHVMDLAEAHVESLNYLMSSENKASCEVYNVGTGEGISVLQLIKAFESVTGKKVPYQIVEPRQGDTISAYADTSKIMNTLGWNPKYSLEQALLSSWNWEKKLNNVF